MSCKCRGGGFQPGWAGNGRAGEEMLCTLLCFASCMMPEAVLAKVLALAASNIDCPYAHNSHNSVGAQIRDSQVGKQQAMPSLHVTAKVASSARSRITLPLKWTIGLA